MFRMKKNLLVFCVSYYIIVLLALGSNAHAQNYDTDYGEMETRWKVGGCAFFFAPLGGFAEYKLSEALGIRGALIGIRSTPSVRKGNIDSLEDQKLALLMKYPMEGALGFIMIQWYPKGLNRQFVVSLGGTKIASRGGVESPDKYPWLYHEGVFIGPGYEFANGVQVAVHRFPMMVDEYEYRKYQVVLSVNFTKLAGALPQRLTSKK